jgi:hypothetical protein
MLAVTVEMRDSTCVVAYDWPGRGPDHLPLPLRLEAVVSENTGGGSIIQIRCAYRSFLPIVGLVSGLFALVPVAVVGVAAWPTIGLGLALFAGYALFERDTRQGPTRRGDPEAAYLIERVERALARVESEHLPLSRPRQPDIQAPAS